MAQAVNIKTRLPVANSPSADNNDMNPYGGDGGGGSMLEARVAKLESDVGYIRRDVDELRIDVKTISQNMAIAIERLDNIRISLDKKPSTDTVDKKITDAKLSILLGVPTIIAIGTGIYKVVQHYL
ncbi:hypothetical protein [Klebsiella pneumoniae]|uniref:hypothetical protein n=1 Tax=Klebsiella pneumoniae TaxID=573 RepID=UPI001D0EB792|nr:hypothetical protein [Klebsiella pneumoniae]